MNTPNPKVAVITGAASGMGLACAHRLLRENTSVVLIDANSSALETAISSLGVDDARVLGIQADVTSSAHLSTAAARVNETLGSPSVLINAAGVLRPTRFDKITEAEWDFVVDVSLKGTFLVSQAFLPFLKEHENGRIVNFSSTAGKTVSTIGGAHYTAAKAAVLGLTRAMAKELAADGITVNAVCPGLIDTDMVRSTIPQDLRDSYAASFPVRRLGRPDEVADLVAFLCSAAAGYITGASLDINGGDLML